MNPDTNPNQQIASPQNFNPGPPQAPAALTQPGVPMVQQAVPPPPPAPEKRSKKPLFVAILALVILVVIGAVITLVVKNKQSGNPKEQPKQATNSQQTTQLEDVIKLTDNVSVLESPTLTLPSTQSGWSTDASQPTGTVGIVHTDGCKLNYVPNLDRRTDNLDDDSAATDAAITRKIDNLKTTGKVLDVTYGTTAIAIAGSQKKLEFKTANLTYETSIATYRLAVTGRVIDGYVLGLNFYCQRDAFSSDLNDAAIGGVVVNLKTKEQL